MNERETSPTETKPEAVTETPPSLLAAGSSTGFPVEFSTEFDDRFIFLDESDTPVK
jgi:hypothetical protein